MGFHKGQVSVEIVIMAGIMMVVLFTVFFVNQHLEGMWAVQKQRLEASAAANQLAAAINQAAAGGNGTRVAFSNSVGPDVTNLTVYGGRSVRAYYAYGGFYSVSLVTNQTNITGPVQLNAEVTLLNQNGTVGVLGG